MRGGRKFHGHVTLPTRHDVLLESIHCQTVQVLKTAFGSTAVTVVLKIFIVVMIKWGPLRGTITVLFALNVE
jgi:hypothetical protein